MVITKKFIYAKCVEGEPKEKNFSLIEDELPVVLNDGGDQHFSKQIYIFIRFI